MKPVLIDVLVGGIFYTQLNYTKRGMPEMIDGDIKEVHKMKDIEDFVYTKLPSLINKRNVRIDFSNQKVLL